MKMVPLEFVLPIPEGERPSMAIDGSIPIIDLGGLNGPDEQRLSTIHAISSACAQWGFFRDCVSAIDGTYTEGEVPKAVQQAYRNRKGKTSQSVLCACDFDMRFTFVAADWKGTAHDSKVLENALVEPTSQFSFPPHDKYYVVDAGFRNTKGFLAPYKGQRYHLQDYQGSEREP